MKNLKSLLLIAVFALGMNGVANAQKVGHINLNRLIANMPETRALNAEMDKIAKTYKDDLEKEKKKFDAKLAKYRSEQTAQTDDENKRREIEVQQDGAKLQRAEQLAIQDMQAKNQQKLAPIYEKAYNAVKEVAATKGVVYVFDASPGRGLLVFEKGEDLYPALKAKLGLLEDIKLPEEK